MNLEVIVAKAQRGRILVDPRISQQDAVAGVRTFLAAASKAQCFWFGNCSTLFGEAADRDFLRLPFPACWFEMDLGQDGDALPVGILSVESEMPFDDRIIPRANYGFKLGPEREWMLVAFWVTYHSEAYLFRDQYPGCAGDSNWAFAANGLVRVATTAINCWNVERKINKPSAIRRAQFSHESNPARSFWTLHIRKAVGDEPEYDAAASLEDRQRELPERKRPRVHLRKGHYRKLSSGRIVWVQDCEVGTGPGRVDKDYDL